MSIAVKKVKFDEIWEAKYTIFRETNCNSSPLPKIEDFRTVATRYCKSAKTRPDFNYVPVWWYIFLHIYIYYINLNFWTPSLNVAPLSLSSSPSLRLWGPRACFFFRRVTELKAAKGTQPSCRAYVNLRNVLLKSNSHSNTFHSYPVVCLWTTNRVGCSRWPGSSVSFSSSGCRLSSSSTACWPETIPTWNNVFEQLLLYWVHSS